VEEKRKSFTGRRWGGVRKLGGERNEDPETKQRRERKKQDVRETRLGTRGDPVG